MTLRAHRAVLPLALWCGTGWLLLRLGDHGLNVPFGSAEHLVAWFEEADPAILAAAALRLVGMVVCGYLAAVTALAMLATLARGRSSAAISAGRLMPTMLRRVLLGTAGAGLASTVVSSPVSPALVAAAADGAEDTAVMVKLEPLTSDETSTSTTSTTSLPSTTSTTPSAAPTSSTTASLPPTTSTTPSAAPEPPSTDAADRHSQTWTVQAGDSFWSIAEEVVAEQLGSQSPSSPTDADIAHYWQALIAANRDRLSDRANPDLLFPGQELSLPRHQWGTPRR